MPYYPRARGNVETVEIWNLGTGRGAAQVTFSVGGPTWRTWQPSLSWYTANQDHSRPVVGGETSLTWRGDRNRRRWRSSLGTRLWRTDTPPSRGLFTEPPSSGCCARCVACTKCIRKPTAGGSCTNAAQPSWWLPSPCAAPRCPSQVSWDLRIYKTPCISPDPDARDAPAATKELLECSRQCRTRRHSGL